MSIDKNLYKDKKIQLDWIYSADVFRVFWRVNAGMLEMTEPLRGDNLRELKTVLNMMDLDEYDY
jgi:hypothetical protein